MVKPSLPLPRPVSQRLIAPKTSDVTGFSLVEVTMALGLMCFVSFGLMGLLPEGMSNMRKSMDNTVQAQITQELASMVQRTSFEDIEKLSSSDKYYYDSEGVRLGSDQKSRAVYEAKVLPVGDMKPMISPVIVNDTLPTELSTAAVSSLRAVTIKIVRITSAASDPGYQFMTYVADSGL